MTFQEQIKRERKAAKDAIAHPEKHGLSYLALCRNFLRIHAGWK